MNIRILLSTLVFQIPHGIAVVLTVGIIENLVGRMLVVPFQEHFAVGSHSVEMQVGAFDRHISIAGNAFNGIFLKQGDKYSTLFIGRASFLELYKILCLTALLRNNAVSNDPHLALLCGGLAYLLLRISSAALVLVLIAHPQAAFSVLYVKIIVAIIVGFH